MRQLSEKLNKSYAQLSQWRNASRVNKSGKPRVISRSTATYIENKCKKPTGWMNTDNSNKERNVHAINQFHDVAGGIGQGVTLRDQPAQGLKTFASSLGLVIRCLAPSIGVTRLSSILACRQSSMTRSIFLKSVTKALSKHCSTSPAKGLESSQKIKNTNRGPSPKKWISKCLAVYLKSGKVKHFNNNT